MQRVKPSQTSNHSTLAPNQAAITPDTINGGPRATLGTSRNMTSTASVSQGFRDPTLHGLFKSKYTKREDSEIYVTKFSTDDEYIAAGYGDGSIKIYQAKTGKLIHTLYEPSNLKVPCTNIAFRPNDAAQTRTKNVLVATYADGKVRHWHATSGKKLSEVDESKYSPSRSALDGATVDADGNQVFAVDYFHDGNRFVTAGSDCTLRVYDEQTQQVTFSLFTGSGEVTAGHSNRIFSAKFHPSDPNVVVSGGWDNTIQFWDIRAQHSVRSIYRPHICGDSVDFDPSGEIVLTGSYLKEEPLQTWSFKTLELIETVKWSIVDDRKPCLLYSACYSHPRHDLATSTAKSNVTHTSQPKYILAGGGGGINNEVKLFRTDTKRCVGMASGFSHTIYSVAVSHSERLVVCGGGSMALHVFDLENTGGPPEFIY